MSNFTQQTQLDPLEFGQAFTYQKHSLKPYYQSPTNSYFSGYDAEEEIRHTPEELVEGLMETRSVELKQEFLEEGNFDMEEFEDNSTLNKKSGWEDHFQIPYSQMCYNTMEGTCHAYQLQFSQEFNQTMQRNIIEIVPSLTRSKKIKKDSRINSKDRKMRVERYLLKKAKRCFIKKIFYACRKTVADNRIRVKGRFVNKVHAQQMVKSDQPFQQKIENLCYLKDNTAIINQF